MTAAAAYLGAAKRLGARDDAAAEASAAAATENAMRQMSRASTIIRGLRDLLIKSESPRRMHDVAE